MRRALAHHCNLRQVILGQEVLLSDGRSCPTIKLLYTRPPPQKRIDNRMEAIGNRRKTNARNSRTPHQARKVLSQRCYRSGQMVDAVGSNYYELLSLSRSRAADSALWVGRDNLAPWGAAVPQAARSLLGGSCPSRLGGCAPNHPVQCNLPQESWGLGAAESPRIKSSYKIPGGA